MRVLFARQLGTSGSVAWDFNHVGMIEAEPAPRRRPGWPPLSRGTKRATKGHHLLKSPTDWTVSRAPAQGFTVLSAKGTSPGAVNPANLTPEQLEVELSAAIDAATTCRTSL